MVWNRPTRVCLQESALNYCFSAKIAISLCEAKTEKADKRVGHVWIKEMNESEPTDEASRKRYQLSKARHRRSRAIVSRGHAIRWSKKETVTAGRQNKTKQGRARHGHTRGLVRQQWKKRKDKIRSQNVII
jgi:hypothetical protein